jgi:hypothetical protein
MYSTLLPHTVQVFARSGRVDRFGQPVDVNPRKHREADIIGTYPCKAYMRSGGLVNQERSIDVFERVHEMFTELNADIQENDAVRVLDETGAVFINLAYIKDSETKYAGMRPHHKEFTLFEQSGPNPGRPTP